VHVRDTTSQLSATGTAASSSLTLPPEVTTSPLPPPASPLSR
jgi:hypothetical protein